MEKVIFQAPDSDESIEFYVVEQTRINGTDYLLVSVEEDGDSDAFILKDVSKQEEEDSVYEMVESEEELEYISKIFAEILEDVDITL
ncbi:DUF1292 domain-containing protein [Roseburia sp. MSJ-14]|uniref:DUF1292 domain-containing protein n=1 Tax=Roseburia sp. MSJ-14 TaxID=2841514 RepID=UPI001C12019B|nr:DUF1292 domain-containing protein [Roseburia sp. MSJ-14]MBU5472540.1 DUF1292 domain-containing protein [Roseburia sp. MSJ-14]